METWMSGAVLVEVAVLSFLLALWIAWMTLRGLFRMLPATRLNAVAIGSTAPPRTGRWIAMQPRAFKTAR